MRTLALLLLVPSLALADASVVGRKTLRDRDWDQLANDLRELVTACHAVGKQQIRNRLAVVLPADCFFAPGQSELRSDAAPRVAIIAGALKRLRDREITVGLHAADKQPRPWRTTSAQAATLVEALVAQGVAEHRLTAIGFGEHNNNEVYDGIATLAPGNALIELAIGDR